VRDDAEQRPGPGVPPPAAYVEPNLSGSAVLSTIALTLGVPAGLVLGAVAAFPLWRMVGWQRIGLALAALALGMLLVDFADRLRGASSTILRATAAGFVMIQAINCVFVVLAAIP
jgi:hypothetical protein